MNHEAIIKQAYARGSTPEKAEAEFFAWLQRCVSCLTGTYSEYVDGEGRCVVGHLRAVKYGSGMGEKPPFCAVPLTQDEHTVQHAEGYTVFNPRDWWGKQFYRHILHWINGGEPFTADQDFPKDITIHSSNQMRAIELRAAEYFKNPNAKPLVVTLCPEDYERSKKQNNAWWGVYIPQMQDFFIKNPKDFAGLVLQMIMEGTLPPEVMHEVIKHQLNDGKSSRTTRIRFTKLIEKSKTFMRDRFKKELDDPIPNHVLGK